MSFSGRSWGLLEPVRKWITRFFSRLQVRGMYIESNNLNIANNTFIRIYIYVAYDILFNSINFNIFSKLPNDLVDTDRYWQYAWFSTIIIYLFLYIGWIYVFLTRTTRRKIKFEKLAIIMINKEYNGKNS